MNEHSIRYQIPFKVCVLNKYLCVYFFCSALCTAYTDLILLNLHDGKEIYKDRWVYNSGAAQCVSEFEKWHATYIKYYNSNQCSSNFLGTFFHMAPLCHSVYHTPHWGLVLLCLEVKPINF